MGGFIQERHVKAFRKRHVCQGCDKWIEPGEPGKAWVGVVDGQFSHVNYHVECREAEVELNNLEDYRHYDDWSRLCETDSENYAWLKNEHPVAYMRMLMTREQWAAYPKDNAQ